MPVLEYFTRAHTRTHTYSIYIIRICNYIYMHYELMVYITNTTISIPGTRMTHLVEVLISKMEGFTSGLGRF